MRVATDVGGTFTDLVYLDEASGELGTAKASTIPASFARGVLETLHKSAINLPKTRFFVHGSTIIINALTERNGAKTALITTKGFRDVLEIGRANRPTCTICPISSRNLLCRVIYDWKFGNG